MVRLLEYMAKEILSRHGVRVPRGGVADNPGDAARLASKIGYPVVLKAQVPLIGRSRIGGVRVADDEESLLEYLNVILGRDLDGYRVGEVLIEEYIDVDMEVYLAYTINYSYRYRSPILIYSRYGGASIEEMASRYPDRVSMIRVDPHDGVRLEELERILLGDGMGEDTAREIMGLSMKLYEIFTRYDAVTLEVNPLGVSGSGGLYVLDCHLVIDDNSIHRHSELGLHDLTTRYMSSLEAKIYKYELRDRRGTGYFRQLRRDTSGCIGFHGIGGGGAIMGLDLLLEKGFKVANYADTSGDPPASKVYRVVKTILSQEGIIGYILLGPVLASQEQWHHAHGIVKALREMLRDKPGFPVLILLAGNKEDESHRIIREALSDLDIRLEIYGREYIYELEYLIDRFKDMVSEYVGGPNG